MFQISPNPRLRRSPFHNSIVAEGCVSVSPYNHMMMPTSYGNPAAEYDRLINGVAMWDVAIERQVELVGPDAAKLAQALCPRKIAEMPLNMGWYVPLCDHRGVVINDPILLKLAEDRFWLSIADSDVLLWARAVAGERGYDVHVFEPDVSPLAVQGPKSFDLVADLLGDWVRQLKYFQFRAAEVDGIPIMVARSGWSKQGGFELYLMDGTRGDELWAAVKKAGKPYGIGPGNPNPQERIESGLLSWGGDTDDETNPYEVRMGRYVDLDAPDETIGIQALRRIHAEGPKRHQIGIKLNLDDRLPYLDQPSRIEKDGAFMGNITAHTWSPRLNQNIGMCLVSRDLRTDETVQVSLPTGQKCTGKTCKLPFI
jgi:glycine cleavage system aminomethyltransferase T